METSMDRLFYNKNSLLKFIGPFRFFKQTEIN